jgi:hypothetical protein
MSVFPDGYYPSRPKITFDWLSQGWALFQAQVGAWIGAMLLYLLIALVLGIPIAFVTGYANQFVDILHAMRSGTPPPQQNPLNSIGHSLLFSLFYGAVNTVLLGGLYRMAVRQGRGETLKATDIFGAFDVALPLIGVGLLNQFCVVIGSYLCIFPGLAVAGLFMFAPLLVVDQKMGPIQALSESVNILKSQWLMAAAFYFVAALVGGLGGVLCLVGLVATYPVFVLSIALGYLTFMKPPGSGQPDYGQAQPGVWPPPPTI